ncbi:MAG: hypothetical protein A2V69_00025 [Candidatus Portnoybacteria bacterium RBG_13_40_8]|uniref:Oxidoreductase n=1 Tax=Candidatus Portnoybacteria bacterium RBG_13_40_8 TaxID=1801990 RepID=A0A1G2F2A0_9BACT|nr:MAG: hypothetical protein A2V69_00025 [Candidatus Portnoybacteria bacterium RBG_13_40_8]
MITVAIVGLGYWGPNLLRVFSSNKECFVKYGCDLLDKNIDKIKNKYPSVIFTKDYESILNDKSVDLVCIATPPETHFKIAEDALQKRKHILIEKPMTVSVETGEQLINLAKEKNRLIMVDHTFVFSPPVIKMKELIENNELGKPLYFDSERINLGLLQEKINVIWDLAPHDFSILTYLFPNFKPNSLTAVGSKQIHSNQEDMAHVTIKYNNQFVAHAHVSWLSPVKMRKMIISGDNKMILYDDMSLNEKIRVYTRGIDIDFSKETPFNPIYRSGDILIPKISDVEPLGLEVEHVVNCIKGKEKPKVDGKAGLAVVKLLRACDESMKSNKEVKV